MSAQLSSSGDEVALCIDTERAVNVQQPPVPKGRGRKKGKGKKKASDDGASSMPPSDGEVVWAKAPGFTFWPAKIFDAENDSVVPQWLKFAPNEKSRLVRFFGTYDMHWMSPSAIETYQRGLDKQYQSKSRSKLFRKAMKEVRQYVDNQVLPEGITLVPPYPYDDEKGKLDHQVPVPPGDASLLEQRPSTDSSTPRKAAAPKRRSGSSSSSDSSVKRRRLSFTADRQREPSPEIQAFTSVPVPLLNPTADPAVVTSTGN